METLAQLRAQLALLESLKYNTPACYQAYHDVLDKIKDILHKQYVQKQSSNK